MDIKAHPESELAAFWRGMPGMYAGSPLPQEVGRCHGIPGISYTNFLVTNGKVLMQKYCREGISSEKVREKDAQAKAVLESCFPGRRVIPIDAFALNVLGGGIHCLTRNIPAPLRPVMGTKFQDADKLRQPPPNLGGGCLYLWFENFSQALMPWPLPARARA